MNAFKGMTGFTRETRISYSRIPHFALTALEQSFDAAQ